MTAPAKLDQYPKISQNGNEGYKPKFKSKATLAVPRLNPKITSKSPLGR